VATLVAGVAKCPDRRVPGPHGHPRRAMNTALEELAAAADEIADEQRQSPAALVPYMSGALKCPRASSGNGHEGRSVSR
jgi:hypothetical protein